METNQIAYVRRTYLHCNFATNWISLKTYYLLGKNFIKLGNIYTGFKTLTDFFQNVFVKCE